MLFVVTKPTLLRDAETAADVLLNNIFSDPHKKLVIGKGTEYFNSNTAIKCSFFGLKFRPKNPHTP